MLYCTPTAGVCATVVVVAAEALHGTPTPTRLATMSHMKRPTIRPALIKNKTKRAEVWAVQKSLKRTERREGRAKRQRETAELGEEVAPRKVVRWACG